MTGIRKPLSELRSDQLIERLHGLSMNLFLAEGRLFVPSHIQELFWETYHAVEKLGPIPPLRVENFVRPTDPFPIFHYGASQFAVRYSQLGRLKEFASGKVSLRRASSYSTMASRAHRDDEMRRSWLLANGPVEIGGNKYHMRQGTVWHELRKKSGDPAHYHILCLSLEESAKLQRAFEAEGYVLIYRYREFYELLTQAIARKYGTTARTSDAIKYYDPLDGPDAKTLRDLVFAKDISFHYQHEARIAILDAVTNEEFISVELDWPPGLISEIRSF